MRQRFRTFSPDYRRHLKETLHLAWPVIIGMMGFNLMGLIDSLMIGDLSYVHLSAASLATGVFNILTIIGMGLSFALSPLVAEADSADRPGRVADLLRQGTYVGLITAVVLGFGVYYAAEILYWLDQPEQDVVLADSYLRILSYSVVPLLVFMIFKQFSDGLSLTRPAMYITLLGLLVNVVGNWLLIYGYWGLPRLELDGAGWGTLLSRLVMMVAMVAYVVRGQSFGRYRLAEGWGRLNRPLMRRIAALGLPSGFQHFFEVGAFVGCTLIIGWMDEASANRAAHQIVLQLASVSFMIVLGFSAAATIRVGSALGRRDWLNLRRAGMTGVGVAIAFMSGSALVFVLGRHFFPPFFNENPRVLEIAASLMGIAALFQIFDGVQAIGVGILRGIQDVRIPTAVTFLAYWVINLPLGYGLGIGLNWGVQGVWYALMVSLAISAILLTSRFWYLSGQMGERVSRFDPPESEVTALVE